jgi:hypothetical protein
MSIKATTTAILKKSTSASPAVVRPSQPQSTAVLLQLAHANPTVLTATQVLQLQRTVGNRVVAQILAPQPALPTPAPIATPVPSTVVQRHAIDAKNYIRRKKLKIKPTRVAVEEYIKDSTKPIEQRRGLLKAWNKVGILDRNLGITEAQKNPIAEPEDLNPKGEKMEAVEDLSGWDSEDETDLDLSKAIVSKSTSKVTIVRSSTGKELANCPVMPMMDAIRIARQIVKREMYNLLPIVSQIGPIMVEYDNPGTKDIYATPLVKDGDKDRWKRAGSSADYNFANLTDHLEQEAVAPPKTVKDEVEKETKEEPRTRKRKFESIMDTFRGTSSELTSNEAEAVGAISCDFMKGSGAMHFIEQAEKHKSEVATSFAPFFKQTAEEKELPKAKRPRLWYRPAEKDGRALVTEHTDTYREHRRQVKPFVQQTNNLVNTIARSTKKPTPTQWGLIRLGDKMKLQPKDMVKLLEPTKESVKAITEEMAITQDIVIHYPKQEKRKSQKFGTYGGTPLPLFYLGETNYSETCDNRETYDMDMGEETKEEK